MLALSPSNNFVRACRDALATVQHFVARSPRQRCSPPIHGDPLPRPLPLLGGGARRAHGGGERASSSSREEPRARVVRGGDSTPRRPAAPDVVPATVDVATPAAPRPARRRGDAGGSAAAPQPVPMETARWSPAAPPPPGQYSPTTPPPPGPAARRPRASRGWRPRRCSSSGRRSASTPPSTTRRRRACGWARAAAEQPGGAHAVGQQARIQVAQFEREFAEQRDAAKREKELVAAEDARIRAIAREVCAAAGDGGEAEMAEEEARAGEGEGARANLRNFGAIRRSAAQFLRNSAALPPFRRRKFGRRTGPSASVYGRRENEGGRVMARKAMAKPRPAQARSRAPSRRARRRRSESSKKERLAKLDDDRRK